MSNGMILFAAITAMTILDTLVAFHFRNLADRAESGETTTSAIDPAGARVAATAMLVMAPVIWLIATLISFGIIPLGGIDPIQL
jgi:hypothetical protein